MFPDGGLGIEGDSETGFFQHGNVVGTVSHCDDLVEMDSLLLGDQFEKIRLALGIDDGRANLSGTDVLIEDQMVGLGIVNPEARLQTIGDAAESPADQGDTIAEILENSDQLFGPRCELGAFEHGVDLGTSQPPKQADSSFESIGEGKSSSHGFVRDSRYFLVNSKLAGELINDFGLDQRRVHVKNNESLGPTVKALGLQRHVDAFISSQR